MPSGYFGIYRGVVLNNADPAQVGRLILQVPAVLGNRQSSWASPSLPPGAHTAVPAAGNHVWVMFEGGATDAPVWMGVGAAHAPAVVQPYSPDNPANLVYTDTSQTITGAKTFSSTITANAGIVGSGNISTTGDVSASNIVYAVNGFYEDAAGTAVRVYSPDNLVPVAGLSATGTADATTFLRGDNTWATVDLSPYVTLTTAQTISGAKTLSGATTFSGTVFQGTVAWNSTFADAYSTTGFMGVVTADTTMPHYGEKTYAMTSDDGAPGTNGRAFSHYFGMSFVTKGSERMHLGRSGTMYLRKGPALGAGLAAPGTAYRGALHFQPVMPGTTQADNMMGITWDGITATGLAGGAQAGLLVQSSGSYGTKMQFYTTDSYAAGLKRAVELDHVGNMILSRGNHYVNNGGNPFSEFGPNSTWSAYLRVGSGTHPGKLAARATVIATDGNLHMDAGDGKHMYLNFYQGARVNFGNGNNGVSAYIDSTGNSYFQALHDSSRRVMVVGERSTTNREHNNVYVDGGGSTTALNAHFSTGWYNVINALNNPWGDGRWFYMQVFTHVSGSHWQRQEVMSMTSGATGKYMRVCQGGDPNVASSWTGWYSIGS